MAFGFRWQSYALGLVRMSGAVLLLTAFVGFIPGFVGAPFLPQHVLAPSTQKRDQLYRRANDLMQSGKFDQAADDYKALIKQWPDFYPAYSLLGVISTQLNKLNEATEYFQKAVELNPSSAEALVNLGANYLALKKPAQAAPEFEKATRLKAASVSAWFNLGVTELQLGCPTRALPALERAAKLSPGDVQILMALAEARFKAKHADSAVMIVRQIGELAKADAMMLVTLGVLLERNGRNEESGAYFERALKLNPGAAADRIMTLAAQSLDEDDYKVAATLLTSVSGLKQNSAEWHGMLGYSHFKLDHIEVAMDHLQKAIRLDPANEDYYLDLAELFGANNAAPASVVVFENGIKALPNSIRMRVGLAVALLLTGNLERAEEEIELAITHQPSSEMAYKVLLEIYDNGMQWSKMQDAAVQFRKLNSRNPLGWYYAAKAEYKDGLENQRSLDTALELIHKALELDPSEWRSHFLLGKILIAESRHKEAIAALREATRLNSQDSRPYYAMATALQRLGKSQEAMNAMKTYQETKSKQQLREFRRLLVDIKGANPKKI